MKDQIEELRAAHIQQYAQYIKLRAAAIDLADALEMAINFDTDGKDAIAALAQFYDFLREDKLNSLRAQSPGFNPGSSEPSIGQSVVGVQRFPSVQPLPTGQASAGWTFVQDVRSPA